MFAYYIKQKSKYPRQTFIVGNLQRLDIELNKTFNFVSPDIMEDIFLLDTFSVDIVSRTGKHFIPDL